MRILITGNLGYIGSLLEKILRKQEPNYEIYGLDTGFYFESSLCNIEISKNQILKDIRDVSVHNLEGFDVIFHLAALSNDPLGEFSHSLTESINLKSTVNIAKTAKDAGVTKFIYASSQSMYGISSHDDELDEDQSNKNPLTAYARTKWEAEQELKQLISEKFNVVCFRPSTVFGVSPMLRCDIVFNNFVSCAYTTGLIEIKSDGTPIRPVVHVEDVCNAFIAGLKAPDSITNGRSYNIGIKDGNFSVLQLAEAAIRCVPGSNLIFTGENNGDERTYKVSFRRIFDELSDWYKPQWDLDKGGLELVKFFNEIGFTEKKFRGPETNRLTCLKSLIGNSKIDSQLRWIK